MSELSDQIKSLIKESFSPSDLELKDREIRKLRRELARAKEEAVSYRAIAEWMEKLSTPQIEPIKIESPSKAEAAVLAVASDWHVEEIVEPGQVSGLNKYSPEIAKVRAGKFWATISRLTNIFDRDLNISTVMIGLLGDFITNYLHEDSPEHTAMMPMEASMLAMDLIASGLAHLIDRFPRKKFFVICHSGNHGRVTRRIHFGTEHGHSLEWVMYCHLAKKFSSATNVKFIVPDGAYHTYTEVLGETVRWHHGHAIRYHGGVGGITIPCNKAIAQWDKAKRADLDVFGHFHQFTDHEKFFCNGSLIGYNAFAVSIKAEYEPPSQGYHIIDSKRGRTHRVRMHLEE